MRVRQSFLVLCILILGKVNPQNSKPKYYLIEGLDINELTVTDRQIIDSCLEIYHSSKEDTTQLNALSHICDNIIDASWARYQVYTQRLIEQKLNTTKDSESKRMLTPYLVNSLNNLSQLVLLEGKKDSAISLCTKALEEAERVDYIYGIGQSYSNLGFVHLSYNELDEAIKNLELSNVYYLQVGAEREQIANLANTAEIKKKKGDIMGAIEDINQCITYYSKSGDLRLVATSKSTLANFYQQAGKLDKALNLFQETAAVYMQLGDEIYFAATQSNIGDIYLRYKEYDVALRYFRSALNSTLSGPDNFWLGYYYNSIGNVYRKINNSDSALYYYEKSLSQEKLTRNKTGIARCLHNLGMVKSINGDQDSAVALLIKSLSLYEDLGLPVEMAQTYISIGATYSKLSESLKAKQFLTKGYELARELNSAPQIQKGAYYLSRVEEREGNYKRAYELFQTYVAIKDSLFNEESKLLAIKEEIARNYEKETFGKTIEIQKQKNKIQNQQLISLLLGLAVIIVLLLLIWRRSNYRIKIQGLQDSLLRTQMKPHFLFNVMASIQGLILKQRNQDAALYLSEISSFLRGSLNISTVKKISIREEIEMLEKYLALEKLRFGERLEYSIEIDSDVNQDSLILPPLILQPIVENSIIHGFKGIDYVGKVILTHFISNDKLKITIRDNGVGLKREREQDESKGLSIVRERLVLAHRKNTLVIKNNSEGDGVTAQLTIVLKP